ncbi:MAG: peptide deformylase [Treponema sp.]|nr:peptide deformylase [Treponema sp.]
MRITKLGEEILRQVSEPVKPEEINDELRAFIDEMFETMIEADGVGLAGPQAGISKRLFVVIADDDVRRVFINPQIIQTSQELCDYDEGCLSIPQVYETISRPAKVTVQALNEKGKPFTLEADGLLARIIQHENDHLDGKLFIDRGDQEFAKKTEEQFQKRLEKAEQRKKEKEAKERRIAAKIAAKEAKKAEKK